MDDKNIEELILKFQRLINLMSRDYANGWGKMADFYEDLGMYDDITKFMDLKPGALWVDLGVGVGNLASRILRETKATVIGVDNNPDCLTIAAQRLYSEGHSVNLNTAHTLGIKIEGDTPKSFSRIPIIDSTYVLQENAANLIFGDIRNLSTLEHYLKGRKADVVTFNFHGTQSSSMFEGNYRLEDGLYQSDGKVSDKGARRINEIGKRIRLLSIQAAGKLLAPEGYFVVTDRAGNKDPNAKPSYTIARELLDGQLVHVDTIKREITQISSDEDRVNLSIRRQQNQVEVVSFKYQFKPK